ncbi:MAG: hypothetical protein LBU64_12375 [Planctomycetota bacterium]|jgi:hypothetical protein|nr:hypothetical protein [Planctomycetota bacterium]
MHDSIAILEREDQSLASPADCRRIRIYRRNREGWRSDPPLDFSGAADSVSTFREDMRELIRRLGDCRIIAGREISGIPYHLLVRAGFAVFEAREVDEDLLEEMAAEAGEAEKGKSRPDSVPTRPVPAGRDGCYRLDIIGMQAAHPEISTKMALRDFFERPFFELELICDHFPPWLETYLPAHNLAWSDRLLEPGRHSCLIRPAPCGE